MLVLDGVHDEMGNFRVSGLPLSRQTNAGATKGVVVEVGEAEPHSAPEEEKPGRWGRSLAGFNCSLAPEPGKSYPGWRFRRCFFN
jgi:hypothetical protein